MSFRILVREPSRIPAPRIERDPAILSSFLTDAAHVPGGFAEGVAFPTNESEVAAVMTTASRVLPVGAQSSLTGGATPRGETLLSTRALTSVEMLDGHRIRVGAGVPLAQLQHYLTERGLYYPPAPTYDGAFVGGTVSTNAAGAATFKYGSTRPWVHAITVALADGSLLDITRGEVMASPQGHFEVIATDGRATTVTVPRYSMPQVAKLSAGYYAAPGMDLIDLFIGSEGTLGIVIEAVLRVIDRPSRASALIVCRDDHQALAVTAALRERASLAWVGRGPLDVSAIEYMDARSLLAVPDAAFAKAALTRPANGVVMLLVQMEVTADEDETLGALLELLDTIGVHDDPLIARVGDDRGTQRFFELREAVPAAINGIVAGAKARVDERIEKTAGDLVVPFAQLEASLAGYRRAFDAREIDCAIWGHVSDGNLHVNVVPHTLADVVNGREVLIDIARDVIRAGGAPLAEHGVGRSAMKQRLLRELYGDEGIEQMRAVKRALDPEWKLSPGVLFNRES